MGCTTPTCTGNVRQQVDCAGRTGKEAAESLGEGEREGRRGGEGGREDGREEGREREMARVEDGGNRGIEDE